MLMLFLGLTFWLLASIILFILPFIATKGKILKILGFNQIDQGHIFGLFSFLLLTI
ncbi:hypothetical protein [Tissierella sp. Yu-01]|uniref:hypothetical protein n=1 Tax=Tissierella sp. Yu-01 TaxID=3035694 RepID=UPI00240D26A0|nr:hypothetical protein [Tissierella sp. Yu-01]WFA09584.1 hypothetical protein P3962_03250 [Tissierella sp. Yu-01]